MPFKDREEYLQYHRDYWKNHPDQVRDRKLKNDFGISLQEYNELFSKQGGVCAICFQPETAVHGKTKKIQRLCVDHNHSTGQVRGLLCSKHNTAIGLINEDIEIAKNLIQYLEGFK